MKPIFTFKCCVFLLFFFISATFFAQVGINTTAPNGILDVNGILVNGDNTGVVLPRLKLTATNVMAPATNPQTGNIPAGTVVYNTATTNNAPNSVSPGMYVWDGGKWIAQFTKKQTAFYESDLDIITTSDEGYRNITGLVDKNFTPKYTGNYKIELKVNYGGGDARKPDNSANGYLNVALQSGVFRLQVNDGSVTKTYSLTAHSYSIGFDPNENGTDYFKIWEQLSSLYNISLSAGTPITFSLSFNQYPSPEFYYNGNNTDFYGNDGRGNVAYDIPCTVEITYIGQ